MLISRQTKTASGSLQTQRGEDYMSELVKRLKNEFQDEDYRHAYDEEFSNSRMATQIKVLREQY